MPASGDQEGKEKRKGQDWKGAKCEGEGGVAVGDHWRVVVKDAGMEEVWT